MMGGCRYPKRAAGVRPLSGRVTPHGTRPLTRTTLYDMKHIHHSDPSAYWHQSQRENSANMHPSAADAGQTGMDAKPSHDEVARKAYEIYMKEGCPQGRDVQHWLDAESQIHDPKVACK